MTVPNPDNNPWLDIPDEINDAEGAAISGAAACVPVEWFLDVHVPKVMGVDPVEYHKNLPQPRDDWSVPSDDLKQNIRVNRLADHHETGGLAGWISISVAGEVA